MKFNGIHQVVLRTSAMDKTLVFYTTILGMNLIHSGYTDEKPSTKQCTLTAGNNTHLTFVEDPAGAYHEHLRKGELHRVAFHVPNLHTLQTMRARLLKKHVSVSPFSTHQQLHSIYFFDPNGILLEINAPA